MKKLLFLLLSCVMQAAYSQSIDQIVDSKIKASELRQKAYADSLFKIKGGAQNPTDPGNGLDSCKRGPEPRVVYDITPSTATLGWDGEDVHGFDYSIYQGSVLKMSDKVAPKGNQESIRFNPSLSPGTYTIRLKGNTCNSRVYETTFTVPKPTGDGGNGEDGGNNGPPPASKGNRSIGMNLTGYGFNVSQANGLDAGWVQRIEAFLNLTHNGKKFKGIDFIRVNVKWYDYEPSENRFRDDKILDLINYCKSRGLKLCIAIIPWRIIGDGMLDRSEWLEHLPDPYWQPSEPGQTQDLVWHAEGNLPSIEKTYMPSLNSAIGREKFKNAVRHLAEFMARYPDYVDYISTATSPGEEYETVIHRANNQILLTGYGQVDLNAWGAYSGGMPVPYPQKNDEEYIAYLFNNSEAGKKWYEFRTKGLKDFHAAFVRGVREGSGGKVRSLGMYAGAGAPSGTWTGLYKLNDIFSAGTSDQPDIIYSSEGDAGSQNSKLMATDLNAGTFPGASLAIEFDPEDLGVKQERNPPLGTDLNPDILYTWAKAFFLHGGEDIHFAMAFDANRINQLAPALWKLRAEFVDTDAGMSGIQQGDHFVFPVTRYNGLQEFREMYSARGGGINQQVKITLTGNPVGDNNTPPTQYQKITDFLNGNSAAYLGSIRVDIKRQSGTVYSYARGNIGPDDQKSVMSVSKGVAAATFLAETYDSGSIGLDDKVSKFIPTWRRPDKENITIRQVVSHTSGIRDETTFDGATTLAEAVDGMANTPLDFRPGTDFRYSTTSYQVLARIAEIISGKNWEQIFNERIRYKCNMQTAEFNPLGSGPVYGNPKNPLAGYGLFASHSDLSNFAEMLRDNGVFNGERVLSAKAVSLLQTNMTGGLGNWGFGFILGNGGLISESAKGLSLFVKPGAFSYVLMTQSSYEATIAANNGLRAIITASL